MKFTPEGFQPSDHNFHCEQFLLCTSEGLQGDFSQLFSIVFLPRNKLYVEVFKYRKIDFDNENLLECIKGRRIDYSLNFCIWEFSAIENLVFTIRVFSDRSLRGRFQTGRSDTSFDYEICDRNFLEFRRRCSQNYRLQPFSLKLNFSELSKIKSFIFLFKFLRNS